MQNLLKNINDIGLKNIYNGILNFQGEFPRRINILVMIRLRIFH